MSNTRFNLTLRTSRKRRLSVSYVDARTGALGGKMLFAFDLDGTLLNSKKEISESNKNAVQKLF